MRTIDKGEQIAAALAYASIAHRQITFPDKANIIPEFWPWTDDLWKVHASPRDNIREAIRFLHDELIRLSMQPEADTKIITPDKSNIIPFK